MFVEHYGERKLDKKEIAIVLIDISGYTRFIKSHKSSMVHAEEIIFQLLESIVEGSEHPLQLNKLEGDAVLMYAETNSLPTQVAKSVLEQVLKAFPVFRAKAAQLEVDRAACPCNACRNIRQLRLKAIIHHGKAVFHKIRQFEELAGEDVIVAHRLLKNSVPLDEYVLMTYTFYPLLDQSIIDQGEERLEEVTDIGPVTVRVFPSNIK